MGNEEKKQTVEEETTLRGNSIMNMIMAETFMRHSELSEKEFLSAIGYADSQKSEKECINIAVFNILLEATKIVVDIKETVAEMKTLFKIATNETKIKVERKDNGRN